MVAVASGQFLSNMLRRLLVISFLSLGGLTASCTGEPTNRTALEQLIFKTNCSDPAANSSACESINVNNHFSSDKTEQRRNSKRLEQGLSYSQDDKFDVAGRKKKGKGYGKKILFLLAASKAALFYMMIHAVAALAGKALVVAKVALVMATAIAIKKATEHHEKTSYEIIKHPHHSYVQTHSTSVDYDHHDHHDHFGERMIRRKRHLMRHRKS